MSLPVRLRRAAQYEYDEAADWYESRRMGNAEGILGRVPEARHARPPGRRLVVSRRRLRGVRPAVEERGIQTGHREVLGPAVGKASALPSPVRLASRGKGHNRSPEAKAVSRPGLPNLPVGGATHQAAVVEGYHIRVE